jgi:hypothetical protein
MTRLIDRLEREGMVGPLDLRQGQGVAATAGLTDLGARGPSSRRGPTHIDGRPLRLPAPLHPETSCVELATMFEAVLPRLDTTRLRS